MYMDRTYERAERRHSEPDAAEKFLRISAAPRPTSPAPHDEGGGLLVATAVTSARTNHLVTRAVVWAARRSFTNNLELPKLLDKSLHKLPLNFGPTLGNHLLKECMLTSAGRRRSINGVSFLMWQSACVGLLVEQALYSTQTPVNTPCNTKRKLLGLKLKT